MILNSQYPIDYCCALSVWNEKYNRKVKKGSKSLRILAPIRVKRKMLDEDDEPIYITRFKAVPVFDITQTEARDETSTLPPHNEVMDESSKQLDIKGLINKIRLKLNIQIEYEETVNRKGISFTGKNLIKVKQGLNDEETFAVLMHELGHQLMHENTKKDKHHKEYDAETVSYILCKLNDVNSVNSDVYTATWTKNKSRLQAYAKISANEIISTVNSIQNKLFE